MTADTHGNRICVAVLALVCCGAARAEVSQAPFDANFSISIGAFITDHDTNVRLDSDAGPGTLVNLENDLGLDSTTNILRTGFTWQYADRHRVHAGAFDLSQVGIRTLDANLEIDGELYVVGEQVITDWKMRLFEIGYGYRLVERENFRWWLDVAVFLQDTAITVAETVTGGDVSTEDVVLPLPKFGTTLEYAFSQRWIGRAGLDLFKLEIGDVGGSLVDFRTALDYRFTDRFSVGLGWHLIDVTVDLNRPVSGWRGRFDWQTRGFMLYGNLAW